MKQGFWSWLLGGDDESAPSARVKFPHVPNGRWEISQSQSGQALLNLWVKRVGARDGVDLYQGGPCSWEPQVIQGMVPAVLRDYEQGRAERERARQRNAAKCAEAERRSQQLGVRVHPHLEWLG